MTQKTNQNPWTIDVRVRERNLKSGSLTDKDLEKFLAGLPDLADQAEAFSTPQPALAQPPAIEMAPLDTSADEDEEEDDEELDEVVDAAPAQEPQAAASQEAAPQEAAPQEAAPQERQQEQPAPEPVAPDAGVVTNDEGEPS